MLTKSALVAIALVAAMTAFAPAQKASAGTDVVVGVGFGNGYGYGGGYGSDDYNNDDDDYQNAGYGSVSCWKGKEIVRWQGFKNVIPYDCGGPIYKYKAWKHGEPYRIRVNWKGYIVSVRPL